jgi:pyruvate,orthophosphate dikinase
MLELGGAIELEAAALRVGCTLAILKERISELEQEGMLERTTAPTARIGLTPQGRDRARGLILRERKALGGELAALYDSFDALNREVKEILLRWQLRTVGGGAVANDHADASYDERVLRDLGRWHARAAPLLERLASMRARYGRYRERLLAAVARAGRGDGEHVSGIRVDSVHLVWWALHADLLAVLGRARAVEDA